MVILKRLMPLYSCAKDNASASLYNIVGFQTHLKWGAKRVFQMIPGLENAEFVRYGVMHRNSYMDSPNLLKQTFQSRKQENLFFAGQMTGVEGYVESAASGLVAGINAARLLRVKKKSYSRKQQLLVLSHITSHIQTVNISNL